MRSDELMALLFGLLFALAGSASLALWTYLAVATVRRNGRVFGPAAGAAALLGGAAAGALMGAVGLCGGLLLSALLILDVYFNAYRDPPEWLAVALAVVPAGLVLAPGLTLWGLVKVWREIEDAPLPPAAPSNDALDQPFDAPHAGGRN